MTTRAQAAEQIESLFSDRGRSLLDAGGFDSWDAALAQLPDPVFQVSAGEPGVGILTLGRDLWNRAGQLKMATALTRALLELHTDRNGAEHPDALVELGALGTLMQKAGRADEGAQLLERSVQGLRSVAGGKDLRLAIVAGNLAGHYLRQQRLEDAEHLLETAYRIRKAVAPATVANVAGQLGDVRLMLGRAAEGLDALRDAWMANLDAHGDDHPITLQRSASLARALNHTGNHRQAVPLWRDLVAPVDASGDPKAAAEVRYNLGVALYHAHKREEGTRLIDEALRWGREHANRTGTPIAELPDWVTFRATMEVEQRQGTAAEGLFAEAVELERRISGDDSAATARRYGALGTLIGQMGRVDEALGYLDSAAALLESAVGRDHAWTQTAVEATVDLLVVKALGIVKHDRSTAEMLLAHAVTTGGRVLGFAHPSVRRAASTAEEHRLRVGR